MRGNRDKVEAVTVIWGWQGQGMGLRRREMAAAARKGQDGAGGKKALGLEQGQHDWAEGFEPPSNIRSCSAGWEGERATWGWDFGGGEEEGR